MATNVNDFLTREAGRIGPQIYKERAPSTPWLAMIKKDKFPSGMGNVISSMTWERTFNTGLTWSDVNVNTGTGNSCNPTPATIEFAQTLQTYNLQQAAVQSPDFCVNDLRTSFELGEQVKSIYETLKEDTVQSWIYRNRDEYIRLADNKVILDSAGADLSTQLIVGTTFAAQDSTSGLTNGVLEHFHTIMTQDGAGVNPSGMQDGVPVYTLLTSRETSRKLIREDGFRDDYRYSDLNSELLKPLGVKRSHNGFAHVIDNQLPRYNWNGTSYDAVPFWITEATTNGTRSVVNPAYHTAEYEDSIIFHEDVYYCLTPEVITSPGGYQKYDPVNYMGDFVWLNIKDRDINPRGDNGFFHGKYMAASKPNKTKWGYVIRHKRCKDLSLVDCSD